MLTPEVVLSMLASVRVLFRLAVASLVLLAAPQLAVAQAAPAAEVEPYRLGPGDELEISIHSGGEQAEAIVLKFPVSGDGQIDVVGAGKIKASGLTTSEVQERIRRRLIDVGYLQRPFVSVNVTAYKSQCVNVAGAVKKQGRFCLSGPTRLLDVLSMAEGVDEETAGRMIVVNRQGASEPLRIDRRDLVTGDLSRAQAANLRVLAGDNIYVPVKSRVCISGPLETAGCYAFDEGATLQEAIAMAGGMKQEVADRANITIRRRGGLEIKVDLDALAAAGQAAPLLEPDDQIIVGEFQRLRFCVNGLVEKPDCVDHVKGITIEGALSKAGGLKANKADRQHILVRRIVDGRQQEYTIDLDQQGPQGAGFLIAADDQIVVQALDCLITVGGGVKEPGLIEMTTGMTLTDALQEAGGSVGPDGFALGKLKAVVLRRGEQVQTIDANAILRGKAPDVPLQCGDRINVPTRAVGKGA